MSTRRKILIERLPQTPCTPEMKQAVIAIAEGQGCSIADVQRDAIALFLKRNGKKFTRIGNKASEARPS